MTREPIYYIGQTAAAHSEQDLGNTYVEVDLSTQYMWYVQDGNVVLECNVVTGLPVPDRITPEGVYSVLELLRDTVLLGEIDPNTGIREYETEVDYWMRITWSGIGFHDAVWQPAFGGTLYQERGSHGCINMSLEDAARLYDLLYIGVPVVVHY